MGKQRTNVRVTFADGRVEDNIFHTALTAFMVFRAYQHEVDHSDPVSVPEFARVRTVAYVNV